jgi:hypothetical protein
MLGSAGLEGEQHYAFKLNAGADMRRRLWPISEACCSAASRPVIGFQGWCSRTIRCRQRRSGEVLFHPDEAVIAAICSIFTRFGETGSARRVWLLRDHGKDWSRPSEPDDLRDEEFWCQPLTRRPYVRFCGVGAAADEGARTETQDTGRGIRPRVTPLDGSL